MPGKKIKMTWNDKMCHEEQQLLAGLASA